MNGMRRQTSRFLIGMALFIATLALIVIGSRAAFAQDTSPEAIQALEASRDGDTGKAIKILSERIAANPNDLSAIGLRSAIFRNVKRYADAANDVSKLIDLSPKDADMLCYERGRDRFCAGDVQGSAEDFDRYVKAYPERADLNWERGIALYYVDRYADGAKQFADYQSFQNGDVENGAFHFLCVAKEKGILAARKEMLDIQVARDRRVPLAEVWGLYRGEKTADDVFTAAKAGEPNDEELKERMFYANLYVGLFEDLEGKSDAAAKHIEAARDNPLNGVMQELPKVHLLVREREKQK